MTNVATSTPRSDGEGHPSILVAQCGHVFHGDPCAREDDHCRQCRAYITSFRPLNIEFEASDPVPVTDLEDGKGHTEEKGHDLELKDVEDAHGFGENDADLSPTSNKPEDSTGKEPSWRDRLSSTPIENPIETLRANSDNEMRINSLEVKESHLAAAEEVRVKSKGQRFVSRTQIEEIQRWSKRVSDVVSSPR